MTARLSAATLFSISTAVSAAVLPIRVVSYNINTDSSTSHVGVDDTLFKTVMGGIGNSTLPGYARPVDILSMQETYNKSSTTTPIVADLNSLYPGQAYAASPLVLTFSGTSTPIIGNGPSDVVYNTRTLQLIASVAVGTPQGSTNGYYRQEGRYLFAPAGVTPTASNEFYLYIGHYKSGSATDDLADRNKEAVIVRTDAATLPAGSRILYTGDFNTGASTEAQYQTLLNTATGTGVTYSPVNAGVDPINTPGNWHSSTFATSSVLSDNSGKLTYRTDFQLVTSPVINDPNGLNFVPNSYAAFGNNGSVGYNGNSSNTSTNTALANLPNRLGVLAALPALTDHLPVVADYNVVTAAPSVRWIPSTGGSWNAAVNWTPDWIPNSAGATANLSAGLTSASTITLDGNKTIGTLLLAGNNGYTITPGTAGALTIDNAGTGNITVASGGHTITAPVSLTSTTNVTVNGTANQSSTLFVNGTWSGPGSLIESGAGTLYVNAAGALAVPLVVNGNVFFEAGNGAVVKQRAVPSLNVSAGGRVSIGYPPVPSGRTVLITPSLSIAATGSLELATNDLIVRGGSLSAVTNAFVQGTLTSAGDSITTLGVILNTGPTGQAIYSSTRQFDGYAPAAADVLAKYTYFGDANLDGKVDGSDYSLIDASFGTTATGWYAGDFNYDGVVDGSDFTLIDNAFNQQTNMVSPTAIAAAVGAAAISGVAAVPEPSAAGLAMLISSIAWRGRSRRRHAC